MVKDDRVTGLSDADEYNAYLYSVINSSMHSHKAQNNYRIVSS